jgi:anti-anti-sigma factor
MAANPVPTPDLNLEVVKTPEETVVHCTGRIISSTLQQFQDTVRGLIPETKRIVLDFTDLRYIDSSGLGGLVGIYLSAKRSNCELKMINLGERIKELLRLTQLAKIFEGHQDMLGMTPD